MIKRFISAAIVIFGLLGLQATPVMAVGPLLDDGLINEVSCQNADGSPNNGGCNYSLNSFVTLGVSVSRIILGVVGALTLLMFIYGGFVMMMSAGNTESVDKGKKIITGAIVGLVIVFTSYTIINFIVNGVFKAKVNGQNAFTGSTPPDTNSGQNRPNDCKILATNSTMTANCVPVTDCSVNGYRTPHTGTKECNNPGAPVCCVATSIPPVAQTCEDQNLSCQGGVEGQSGCDEGYTLVEPQVPCSNPLKKCCIATIGSDNGSGNSGLETAQ